MSLARIMGVFAIVSVAAVIASAQIVTSQVLAPNNTNLRKYTMSGTVVNSVTGEPLRRALVEVYAQEPRAMLTDADGHFEFTEMVAGSYSLQVRKPGFFREQDIKRQFMGNNIALGPDTKPITVKLMPEGAIAGSVTDQDGLPIARFQVHVKLRQVIEGRAQWNQMQAVNTDEYGQYRIAGLVPGSYVVSVGPSRTPVPPIGTMKEGLLGYREIYFPNATDSGSAALIQVRPGQKADANFSLAPESFYSVRGVVIGAQGGNVNLMLRSKDEGSRNRIGLALADPSTGVFEAKFVSPGSYILEAASNDNAGHMTVSALPLVVNRDLPNIRIALQAPTTIPVEVEEKHVSTKQAEQRIVGRTGPPASVNLIPRDDSPWGGPGMNFDKGRIVLVNVQPGRYIVRADAQYPWYVDSVTQGSADLLSEDLAVTSSAQQQPIEVGLRDDGATLRVSLKSDVAEAQATLLLIPDSQKSRAREYPISAQGGSYIPPLKPGSYTLLAFDDASDLEYLRADVMEPYMSRAVHITLNADEESTVKVELIRRRTE